MKLMSLNMWGGRMHDELMRFLKKQAESIDVICLQEVYSNDTDRVFTREQGSETVESMWESKFPPRANNFQGITKILTDFKGFYHSAQDSYDYHGKVDFQLSYGLALFVRSSLKILSTGEEFVFRWKNSVIGSDNRTLGRNIQYVRLLDRNEAYTIVNFHGLWNGQGKTDSPDRIEQSRKVKSFIEKERGKILLCGDFNLQPETESMRILEKGMKNLIREFGIISTRSQHYEKPIKYADYVLVSPDITINSFEVPKETVSDHLPMLLDFH